MIYLNNTTEPQTVAIPLEEPWTFPEPGEAYTFTLRSTFCETTVTPNYDGDYEGGDLSELGHYALLGIVLPEDLPDGSYEYAFRDHTGRLVASGCCTLGAYAPEVEDYDNIVTYEPYTE